MAGFTRRVRSFLGFSVHSLPPLPAAVLLILASTLGSFCADTQAAPASTNRALTAADVADWDLVRCRKELDAIERDVRSIPDQMEAAQAATAAARKQEMDSPSHQAAVAEIAKLSKEIEKKRQDLSKAVDDSSAVKKAREQEAALNVRLEAIHKSIGVAREQMRKQLVKKAESKADAAPAHNP